MLLNCCSIFHFSTTIRICLIAYLIGISLSKSEAQQLKYEFGARSASMGNANSTLCDAWSIFNNVGGFSAVEHTSVFFGYDTYSKIEGFDRIGFGAIQPFKFGNVGISAFQFGDPNYRENILSAAYSNKIGFVRLGIKASYFQLNMGQFGNRSTIFLDLGGVVDLIEKLHFGAYISNFGLSQIETDQPIYLPVKMSVGLSYRPTTNVILNVDLFKHMDFDPEIKVGLEYKIIDKFLLRTGINSAPFRAFFGGGIILGQFHIDYANANNEWLGASHQVTVLFDFQN